MHLTLYTELRCILHLNNYCPLEQPLCVLAFCLFNFFNPFLVISFQPSSPGYLKDAYLSDLLMCSVDRGGLGWLGGRASPEGKKQAGPWNRFKFC